MEAAAQYLFSVDPSERDIFGDAAAILSADPKDLDNILTLSIASVPAGKHTNGCQGVKLIEADKKEIAYDMFPLVLKQAEQEDFIVAAIKSMGERRAYYGVRAGLVAAFKAPAKAADFHVEAFWSLVLVTHNINRGMTLLENTETAPLKTNFEKILALTPIFKENGVTTVKKMAEWAGKPYSMLLKKVCDRGEKSERADMKKNGNASFDKPTEASKEGGVDVHARWEEIGNKMKSYSVYYDIPLSERLICLSTDVFADRRVEVLNSYKENHGFDEQRLEVLSRGFDEFKRKTDTVQALVGKLTPLKVLLQEHKVPETQKGADEEPSPPREAPGSASKPATRSDANGKKKLDELLAEEAPVEEAPEPAPPAKRPRGRPPNPKKEPDVKPPKPSAPKPKAPKKTPSDKAAEKASGLQQQVTELKTEHKKKEAAWSTEKLELLQKIHVLEATVQTKDATLQMQVELAKAKAEADTRALLMQAYERGMDRVQGRFGAHASSSGSSVAMTPRSQDDDACESSASCSRDTWGLDSLGGVPRRSFWQ